MATKSKNAAPRSRTTTAGTRRTTTSARTPATTPSGTGKARASPRSAGRTTASADSTTQTAGRARSTARASSAGARPPRVEPGGREASLASAKAASRATVGGPARPDTQGAGADLVAQRDAETQRIAASMPANAAKPREFGRRNAVDPPEGMRSEEPLSPMASSSTLSETNASPKTGTPPAQGTNEYNGALQPMRTDSSSQRLTTNQGVPVADNQNSLKAGLRGPALLEDFILREKITHFDHERIPERVVHARGSGAHGFFECYEALTDLTRAAPFREAGKRTPVFVRFSTVAGERGSIDTARDVRGFATKFYTDEGNWDLVGNNIPVFFIQDAIKFPDLVHALKPEPHHAMPQAASAHDTFWDFVSLMPESAHMLMWVMSDRAIPRSYRMMQGFGVHTFRLVNERGQARLVKFHWRPLLGTHSLVWDEAMKIAGADPDFHRRDLWEAIEAGDYPEYELGLQVFDERDADRFSFDVLDATKIVPEELVPVQPVGRMVLNRNPDNFFAETEQIAFCTAHVVPGIDFTNDPLLAGRIHSYVDTQLTRLGGPNFHEIPINAPIAPVHNNQRDGFHRHVVHRGRVAYEPNSLAGGCPFQTGATGFVTFPEPVEESKLRGKPEKFAEHYNQATLFWNSQTDWEKRHIVGAFRFELSKVTVPAIRERMVASLANVDAELADAVASGLGIDVPQPMPRVGGRPPRPEVVTSPALSLTARPGDGAIRTRKVAILVAGGVAGTTLRALIERLLAEGAVVTIVAGRLGAIDTTDGEPLQATGTLENSAPVLFDGVVLPSGKTAVDALANMGHVGEFVVNHYRHCKTILALGDSAKLLEAQGVSRVLPDGRQDPGVLLDEDNTGEAIVEQFVAALGRHRHPERESDPPIV